MMQLLRGAAPSTVLVLAGLAAAAALFWPRCLPLVLAAAGVGLCAARRRRWPQSGGPPKEVDGGPGVTVEVGGDPLSRADQPAAATSLATTSAIPTDRSITPEERPRLTQLREALKDLQAPDSGVSAAVYDKHVNCDYRLVRYLRARPTVAAAAEMARESLRWRTAFGADDILRTFRPEPWMLRYFGAPCFLECIEQGKSRLACYQRDLQGHLTVYWRGGPVDWRTADQAFHSNLAYVLRLVVWTIELLLEDMERLHERTAGAIPSYVTFVYDLEGFQLDHQLAVPVLLPVLERLFNVLKINYPEVVHRILIIRAPWLFASLWAALRPVIPKELLDKMVLSGDGKASKVVHDLTPTLPLDQIPKFLGGTLVDPDGDAECRHAIGPSGPFLPDKGRALLQEGIDHPPPSTL